MARVNIEAVKEAIYDLIEAGSGVYEVAIEDDQFDNNRYAICIEWTGVGEVDDFSEEELKNPVLQVEDSIDIGEVVYQPVMYVGYVPRDIWYYDSMQAINNDAVMELGSMDDIEYAISYLLDFYEEYSKPLKEAWEDKEDREWCAENNVALDDGTSFDSCIFDLSNDKKYSEYYETVAWWAMEDAIYDAVKEHGPFDNIQALHECLINEYI